MNETPVRVLIVDDDPLVRSALRLMLAETADIEITGEAADGSEVDGAVAAQRPDVVLMDLRMPTVDGISATTALRSRPDAPEVLVLTTFDTDEQILRALRAGAVGYLVKDTPPAEIEAAIRRAAAGEPCLSPAVARSVIAAAVHSGADQRAEQATRRLALLTEQERAVAQAVARGYSNSRTADELYLSLGTVKSYLSSALGKLELQNRTQLALLVHDAGLI